MSRDVAVWLEDGRLELRAHEPRPVAPGEARIRVRLAGVCSTDLELRQGYMGFRGVPGHEFVGEVAEGPDDWRGTRVVGEINAACGCCATCRRGCQRHCPQRTVLGILGRAGAHASELVLPLVNLHRVPAGIPDEVAVFTEPLAAAWHAVEQVAMTGRRVAVLGIGKLGHLIARAARLAGAEVVGIGRSAGARERLEAAGVAAIEPAAAVARSFDVAVEATGSPAGLEQAARLVRPLGTIVLKTTTHAPVPVPLAPLVVDELTLVGSRCGRFEPALAALADGRIDPTPLIDARLPLAEAAVGYARAAEPGAFKVLLTPG